jgi:DNA-binding XRE family transcriptional regulator
MLGAKLQLDRTARLVKRLKSHCEENKILQKNLALRLGLSPQGIFEIFKGNNSPSAETALHIVEIIEPKFMSIIVDPPQPPRQAAGTNPNFPRNLEEARSRIAFLNQEIAQLKGGAVASSAKPATGTAKPKLGSGTATPTIATPSAERLSPTPMPINYPAPEKKTLPASANTPFLITEILKVTSFEDCLALLSNPAHTPLQRSLIFAEIKTRRAIAG